MTATRLDYVAQAFTGNGTLTAPLPVNGGVTLIVSGSTLGGGNVTLQTFDGTNWVNAASPVSTINTQVSVVCWGLQARAVLAGATAPDCRVTLVFNDNGQ